MANTDFYQVAVMTDPYVEATGKAPLMAIDFDVITDESPGSAAAVREPFKVQAPVADPSFAHGAWHSVRHYRRKRWELSKNIFRLHICTQNGTVHWR